MSYQDICKGLYKKAMKKRAVNELLQMIYSTAKKVPALKFVKNIIDNVTDKADKADKEKAETELPAKEQPADTKMGKKASSEQLKKLASLIGMRKKAEDATGKEYVPYNYINERTQAAQSLPYPIYDLAYPQLAHPVNVLLPRYKRIKKERLPQKRAEQVNDILRFWRDPKTLDYNKGPVPGSNDYNALRKYWIQRGEGNWYNQEHPTKYIEQTPVPQLQNEYPGLTPDVIRGIGNTIVDNNSHRKHKTHV